MNDARDAQQRASDEVDRHTQQQQETTELVEGLDSSEEDTADDSADRLAAMSPSAHDEDHVRSMPSD